MTLATVLFSRAEMIRNRSSDACDSDVDLDLDFASAMGGPPHQNFIDTLPQGLREINYFQYFN
jgi:hypothetical protein